MKKEVVIHRDDLAEMLKFAEKYPQSEYLTINVDSSSGIGSLVDVSVNAVVNGDVVTIIRRIVDESSW